MASSQSGGGGNIGSRNYSTGALPRIGSETHMGTPFEVSVNTGSSSDLPRRHIRAGNTESSLGTASNLPVSLHSCPTDDTIIRPRAFNSQIQQQVPFFSINNGSETNGPPRPTNWLSNVIEYFFQKFSIMSAPSRLAALGAGIIILGLFTLIQYSVISESFIFFNILALNISLAFIMVSIWLAAWILSHDEGDLSAQHIAWAIREGSDGFYSTINKYISRLALVVAGILFIVYATRSEQSFPPEIRDGISPLSFAGVSSITFLLGALCSALSGYAGVWVSGRTNSRVSAAAHRTYKEALTICFRGGGFSSIINVSLAVGGISVLLLVCHSLFPEVAVLKLPLLLVGFGFGASFVAMFAQLGGGIYTKAADVGADLVGKVEAGIPEDDYRNPAVIADLVGDNVGDCAGQCADLFESLSAEIISAMILGSSLASALELDNQLATGFVLFPLAIHSMDLIISTIAILFTGVFEPANGNSNGSILPTSNISPRNATSNGASETLTTSPYLPSSGGSTVRSASVESSDPLKSMVQVYLVTCFVAALGSIWLCRWLLYVPQAPNAWKYFASCAIAGIACAIAFLFTTQYYTDYKYSKVRKIAEASKSGAATNIIAGLSVGMESTGLPVIAIAIAIVFSYHQGVVSGIAAEHTALAGLFGTAIATMGMLSTGVYILAMSSFGPIADNAGGIVEMSSTMGSKDPIAREITDKLDAVGNVTKANTKGFSVGTAALASFLLFSAFLDEVSIFGKRKFNIVDITSPDVFVGGQLGACSIFVFSALALNAVGVTAMEVVQEVRRQFKERPFIMEWKEMPDYKRCVVIVSRAAIRQMMLPGLIAIISPLLVGVLFKWLGEARHLPLLGVEALGAFMMFATSTGVLMALFLNNAGGAWDNAKKYIESGKLGGKGSDAHKAAIVGDTVGDPCKDTAGPSVHVLIKLIATITLVMTPLFITNSEDVAEPPRI